MFVNVSATPPPPLKDGHRASEAASKQRRRVMQASPNSSQHFWIGLCEPDACPLPPTHLWFNQIIAVSFHCSLHTLGDYLHSRRCARPPQSFKGFKTKPNIKRSEDSSSYKLPFKDIFRSLNILFTWRQNITFCFPAHKSVPPKEITSEHSQTRVISKASVIVRR